MYHITVNNAKYHNPTMYCSGHWYKILMWSINHHNLAAASLSRDKTCPTVHFICSLVVVTRKPDLLETSDCPQGRRWLHAGSGMHIITKYMYIVNLARHPILDKRWGYLTAAHIFTKSRTAYNIILILITTHKCVHISIYPCYNTVYPYVADFFSEPLNLS